MQQRSRSIHILRQLQKSQSVALPVQLREESPEQMTSLALHLAMQRMALQAHAGAGGPAQGSPGAPSLSPPTSALPSAVAVANRDCQSQLPHGIVTPAGNFRRFATG